MLCRLKSILSQIENIFRNGWDHFCEWGDWTAANHRLYAVTYDHIFHKYELHKKMNNHISRPYVECKDCQIFIILHKNYDYEYETDQRWARFDLIAILALAGSELSQCRQLLAPARRAGLSRTPLIIFRLPGVRGRSLEPGPDPSYHSVLSPHTGSSHCSLPHSVSQCHSPRVTSNHKMARL